MVGREWMASTEQKMLPIQARKCENDFFFIYFFHPFFCVCVRICGWVGGGEEGERVTRLITRRENYLAKINDRGSSLYLKEGNEHGPHYKILISKL